MMAKAKRGRIGAGLLAIIMMLSACGPSAPVEGPEAEKRDIVTFYGYYDAPPAVNGNVMSNSGSPSSVYFQYARLIEYAPFDQEHYHYILAEKMEQEENRTVITLREGLTWSDGTPLTARDVVCTYNMLYMQDYHFWQDLEKCEARDERTVVFHWHEFSEASLIRALNIQISMSEKNYGQWAASADEFISHRLWDEENLQYKDHPAVTQRKAAVMQACYEWLPELESAMCSGAYTVVSVSNSEIRLEKNPCYYNAENVKVENLSILRTVSNEAYMAAAMGGELDVDTCGLLPDMYDQVEQTNPGMKTVYTPMLSQQVLEFNLMADYVSRSEVRQAIAYVVERENYLPLTEVGYEAADEYCTGLSPLWRDQVASEQFLSTLTAYSTDTVKAEQLLSGIGWTRGEDHYWRDETGKTVELEIVATNTYMSYFVCGEAAALMLDEFGIKCRFNTMELAAYNSYIGSVVKHAILPVLTWVLTSVGTWALSMRALAVSVLGEDYIVCAKARGLREGRIVRSYVGTNAVLPQITQLAITFGGMFAGSVLVENTFNYPGMGYFFSSAISGRDYPLMQGMFLVLTIAVVLANQIAEILYCVIDPRIRKRGK